MPRATAVGHVDDSPIGSATIQNQVLESSEDYQLRKRLGQPSGRGRQSELSTDVVKILNTTGAALRQGEVVDLTENAIDALDPLHPWFTCDVPDGTRPFAIVLCDVPNSASAIGRAQVSGRCLALVNFSSVDDTWASVEASNDVLQSDATTGSVRILSPPQSTGEQLVWVKFESPPGSVTLGVPAINNSGEIIPPGGILDPQTTANIGGFDYIVSGKVSTTFRRRWLVNGITPVIPGALFLGSWFDDLNGYCAIDPGSISIIGSIYGWGPRPGSFLLFPAYFGFEVPGTTIYSLFGTLVTQARQREVTKLIGLKLLADMEYDAGGVSAEIWHRDHLELRRKTEFNPVKVFDGLKMQEDDPPIEKGSRIDADWVGNAWELANSACKTEDEQQSQQSAQSQYGGASQYQQLVPPASPSFPSL